MEPFLLDRSSKQSSMSGAINTDNLNQQHMDKFIDDDNSVQDAIIVPSVTSNNREQQVQLNIKSPENFVAGVDDKSESKDNIGKLQTNTSNQKRAQLSEERNLKKIISCPQILYSSYDDNKVSNKNISNNTDNSTPNSCSNSDHSDEIHPTTGNVTLNKQWVDGSVSDNQATNMVHEDHQSIRTGASSLPSLTNASLATNGDSANNKSSATLDTIIKKSGKPLRQSRKPRSISVDSLTPPRHLSTPHSETSDDDLSDDYEEQRKPKKVFSNNILELDNVSAFG